MDEYVYWIWLAEACTKDSTHFRKLTDKFKDARAVYAASDDEIRSCIGTRTSDYNLLTNKDLTRAGEILDFCRRRGVGLVRYGEPGYPRPLTGLTNPPVVLYYRGTLPDFSVGAYIAVVGTRHLSEYGKKMAFSVSYDLARAGATVVSGMAVGIDGVAHAAALAAGGSAVAVIGSGIDICYPPAHLTLAREIVRHGCVLTEFAPSDRPLPHHFPQRNRIISGLSAATVLIEGTEKSGALITARDAFAQSRRVYALPGNVTSPTSRAAHLLLQNGARLIASADDIVRDFEYYSAGPLDPHALSEPRSVKCEEVLRRYAVSSVTSDDPVFAPSRTQKRARAPQNPSPSGGEDAVGVAAPDAPSPAQAREQEEAVAAACPDALALYRKLPDGEGVTVEELVGEDMSVADVLRCITKLEVGGFAEELPGGRVRRMLK